MDLYPLTLESTDLQQAEIFLNDRIIRSSERRSKHPQTLDSIHIIRLPLRWAGYSRTKLRNGRLDTHTMMASFDTNDFMSYV